MPFPESQNDPAPPAPSERDPSRRGSLWHRFWSPREMSQADEAETRGGSAGKETDLIKPDWDGPLAEGVDTPAGKLPPTADPPTLPDVLEAVNSAGAQGPVKCLACAAELAASAEFCSDCGFVMPALNQSSAMRETAPAPTWHEQYLPKQILPSRPGVQRWLAESRLEEQKPRVEVYYSLVKDEPIAEPAANELDDTVNLHSPLDPPSTPSAQMMLETGWRSWPGAKWLYGVLRKIGPGVPEIVDYQELGQEEILVLRPPVGRSLWDAWEDSQASLGQRFSWLRQIAELLVRLHEQHVLAEALRPEMFIVSDDQDVVLADSSELLPLPLPPGVPMKGALSTAPELVLAPELVDGRADLFPFGALVYALHHGRELTEMDFDAQGVPRSFVTIFPDGHPLLARLVLKTFTRVVDNRFPTAENDPDPTGFRELIDQLRAGEVASAALRLEISGWSSTGMIRSENEDAFGIFHSAWSGQERWNDQALVILADGMGGCNAGEVASALAIAQIRELMLQHAPLTILSAGSETPPADMQAELKSAIQKANHAIHSAAEQGDGAQVGMGCTCEAAWISGGQLILGHVGDSRTYLFRQGQLRQLTTDQTMVNRMVALGVLTPEEALNHPRRHELDQALGSSHPLDIQMLTESLSVGDMFLLCSDGLTGHVADRQIAEVLRNTRSAELAARQLVNLANALGGSDNVTVIVGRVA